MLNIKLVVNMRIFVYARFVNDRSNMPIWREITDPHENYDIICAAIDCIVNGIPFVVIANA